MTNQNLISARETFIQGTSQIAHFWGFPKAMGAIYGAIYLSPTPLSLADLVEQVGVTKGAVSTNVRQLERLGMIHKHLVIGDRKDYYRPETDFWKIIKGILQEREKSEFDAALKTVNASLEMVSSLEMSAEDTEIAPVYQERLQAMSNFFNTIDNIVATLLALEELRITSLGKLFSNSSQE